MAQKRGKVFTWPVSPVPSLKPKGILPRGSPKCALSAKVRLADALDIAGERTFNAPARNYTLAYAARLRRQAEGKE